MKSEFIKRVICFLLGVFVAVGGYMVGRSDTHELPKKVEFESITCEDLSVKGQLTIGQIFHTPGYSGIITMGTQKDSASILLIGAGSRGSISVDSDGGSIHIGNEKETSASIMAISNHAHLVLSNQLGEKDQTLTTYD